MRRPSVIFILLASSSLLFPACQFSVGDGDFEGDGGEGGVGGEESGSGGMGDGGMNAGTGGGETGTGGSVSEFVPSAFVPPSGLPAQLPEVIRMGGYSADSAALRIRDAFRAAHEAVNVKLINECQWGEQGDDHRVAFDPYYGLCSLACLSEHLICEDDAELYVCDTTELDSSSASTDLAICLSECETFVCDDDSSDGAVRCNAEIDCDDASDEKGCGDLSFVCADESMAVSGFAVCDGEEDCTDGSDESNCGDNGFVCGDGTRIQAAFQCDGSEECEDGSDEEDCGALLFDCGDDFLVAWYRRCDGEVDCPDASDEDVGCADLDPEQVCTYGY